MAYNLPPISLEQELVISNLASKNIIIDAIAGSGKTTTNLYVAINNKTSKILLLTYNKKLKLETREKSVKLNLDTIVEVHSYHSFCVKYYNRECFTDKIILELIKDRESKKLTNFNYDIIILDEAQDMSPLYFELVNKIFKDNDNKNVKLIVLGDVFQSIYDFNKADQRYISFADKLFNNSSRPFMNINLSQSFRVTHQVAEFINNCLLKNNRINSTKQGGKPKYLVCDVYNSEYLYKEIKYYLDNNYTYDDIFILAPSVKSKLIVKLANRLTLANIPIYVPSEEEKLDLNVLKGKITFSSFHQSKGLERKVVFVFCFDNSYSYYKKNIKLDTCSNELYVAVTRVQEHLTLVHHYRYDYLPFVNKDALIKYSDVVIVNEIVEDDLYEIKENNNTSICVTDLTKHLPVEVISDALAFIEIKEIRKAGDFIKIKSKIQQGDLFETVSELTGIAIPAYYELLTTKRTGISSSLTVENVKIDNLLKAANFYNSKKTGYDYKLKQIDKYDWVTSGNLLKSYNRLENILSSNSKFEIYQEVAGCAELHSKKLCGYIDAVDNLKIWEFKCVTGLTDEHILQLAIYAYLVKKKLFNNNKHDKIEMFKYYLYNILDDNLLEICASLENLTKLVNYLVTSKYLPLKRANDMEFLEINNKIRDKYKT